MTKFPEHEDLTPEGQLLADLAYAAEANGDPEIAHSFADEALLRYVDAQMSTTQAHTVRDAFDAVRKWYA